MACKGSTGSGPFVILRTTPYLSIKKRMAHATHFKCCLSRVDTKLRHAVALWCCSKELHEEQLQLHIQRSEVIPKQRHLAQSTCFILAAAAAVTAATFQG
eukprot:1161609-Pelagomonas_calceolata.AAC.1